LYVIITPDPLKVTGRMHKDIEGVEGGCYVFKGWHAGNYIHKASQRHCALRYSWHRTTGVPRRLRSQCPATWKAAAPVTEIPVLYGKKRWSSCIASWLHTFGVSRICTTIRPPDSRLQRLFSCANPLPRSFAQPVGKGGSAGAGGAQRVVAAADDNF
jgi:hypothetical protein